MTEIDRGGRGLEPSFTVHEFARLVDCVACRGTSGAGRVTAGAGAGDVAGAWRPGPGEIHALFNDPGFMLPPPEGLSGGQVDGRLFQTQRSEEILRQKFDELQTRFASAYHKWQEIGDGDPTRFAECVGGDHSLVYLFARLRQDPALTEAVLNRTPPSPLPAASPVRPVATPPPPAISPLHSGTPCTPTSAPRKRRIDFTPELPQEQPDYEAFFAWVSRIDGFIEEEKRASWPKAMETAQRIRSALTQRAEPTDRVDAAIEFIQSRVAK